MIHTAKFNIKQRLSISKQRTRSEKGKRDSLTS